ncbi:hypothetical protein OIO90_006559 [Microbotryomycetes sp. JL221]|nr:hypothetical protein OIO90_006559 [Microbotryomycetes sp. JL221]
MTQALRVGAQLMVMRGSGFLNMAPDSLAFLEDEDSVSMASYSAATSPATSTEHGSGWSLSVELDREGRTDSGPSSCWRSGETLRGLVVVRPTPTDTGGEGTHDRPRRRKRVVSVIARAFWQSSTMYRVARVVQEEAKTGLLGKLKPTPALRTVAELRGEWHRSDCNGGTEGIELWHGGELAEISREVEGDFPLLGQLAAERQGWQPEQPGQSTGPPPPPWQGDPDSHSLPFSIKLPTISRVTSCNALPQSGGGQRRLLQSFKRTPPSSLPGQDGKNGAIEWVVEVLVRFADNETEEAATGQENQPAPEEHAAPVLPEFVEAVSDSSPGFDMFGLIHSTPSLAVQRIVFPFEALDHHAQDLYSAWRPKVDVPWAEPVARYNGLTLDEVVDPTPVTEGVVPAFGRDPRDEALGGSHMGPKRQYMSSLVDAEGGRDKWLGYEKRMSVKGRFSRMIAWVRSEIHIPRPATFNRHDSHITVLGHFSLKAALTTSNGPPRSLTIEKIIVVLTRRILTKGGRDERPRYSLEEVRRDEIKLWETRESELERMTTLLPAVSRASLLAGEVEDGRAHLRLVSDNNGVDLKLEIPLQTSEMTSKGRMNIPARDLRLSTRAPNIEVEYVMSITVHPVGQPSFYAARVPMQLLAGDLTPPPEY